MVLHVEFVETPIFTNQITNILDDAEYRQLQATLIQSNRTQVMSTEVEAGCERFDGRRRDGGSAEEFG